MEPIDSEKTWTMKYIEHSAKSADKRFNIPTGRPVETEIPGVDYQSYSQPQQQALERAAFVMCGGDHQIRELGRHDPNQIAFLLSPEQKFVLRAGLTLVLAETSGGKSIVARSLALAALESGFPAVVVPIHEPDQYGPFDGMTDTMDFIAKGKGPGTFQTNLPNLKQIAHRMRMLVKTRSKDLPQISKLDSKESEEPVLMVLDSISLVMRLHGTNPTLESRRSPRSTQGTMEGGFQPADIEFVTELHHLCFSNNISCLGVVSNDLVPFGKKLEGVCEGRLDVVSESTFRVRGRHGFRMFVPHSINPGITTAVTQAMGYGELRQAQQASRYSWTMS